MYTHSVIKKKRFATVCCMFQWLHLRLYVFVLHTHIYLYPQLWDIGSHHTFTNRTHEYAYSHFYKHIMIQQFQTTCMKKHTLRGLINVLRLHFFTYYVICLTEHFTLKLFHYVGLYTHTH